MATLNGIAIVTGAGSGIGRECALGFAFAGAAGVVFADRNLPAAEEAAETSRRISNNHDSYHALVIQVDVADRQSVEGMLSRTLEKFGRVDYCVNAAGVCPTMVFDRAEQTDSPRWPCADHATSLI